MASKIDNKKKIGLGTYFHKMNDTKEKKGGNKWIIFLLVLILIVVSIYVFNNLSPEGNIARVLARPSLSVELTGRDAGFSLTQGCKTTLKGNVSNYGNANAENARVSCRIYGTKGATTGSQDLGMIYKGENVTFTINIDNDCPKPDDARCDATCSNC